MCRYLINRHCLREASDIIGRRLIAHELGLVWAEVSLTADEAAKLRKFPHMRLEIA